MCSHQYQTPQLCSGCLITAGYLASHSTLLLLVVCPSSVWKTGIWQCITQCWLHPDWQLYNNSNKSAQSDLGIGLHRGTVAHICRKVPIGYTGMPQIRPKSTPFCGPIPKPPLPASSLDPSDLWCQMASGSDPLSFHNALERPTHGRADRSSAG